MRLSQSLAIIEYLDEVQPSPPLLPADALSRAQVRSLAQHVACEIGPLNQPARDAAPAAPAGPGRARAYGLVPALDCRRLHVARAAPGWRRRRLLLRRHAHLGRSVPRPAGLQCETLRLRPRAVPDHPANRGALPRPAGVRGSRARTGSRTPPEAGPLNGCPPPPKPGPRRRTAAARIRGGCGPALTGRTSRARARRESTVSPGQQPPQLGPDLVDVCARVAPRRAGRAPTLPPGSAGSRACAAPSAAIASSPSSRSIVTRSPQSGLSQVMRSIGRAQAAIRRAPPWPRPGSHRCRARWVIGHPSRRRRITCVEPGQQRVDVGCVVVGRDRDARRAVEVEAVHQRLGAMMAGAHRDAERIERLRRHRADARRRA